MTDRSRFHLTLLTRDPVCAEAGAAAGIEYIGIDAERIGKAKRQSSIRSARINNHEIEDLRSLRGIVAPAALLARLNPLGTHSADEVESALAMGAEVLILPQFTRGTEIAEFRGIVAGRARVIPLLEHAAALEDLDAVLSASGDGELMVGLNDLALSLGHGHPLCLAASKLLEDIASAARSHRILWGFGGVTTPAPRSDLPVQPDDLLARYAELGAEAAWISRSMTGLCTPGELTEGVTAIRARIDFWRSAGVQARKAAKARLESQIEALKIDLLT